jgi:hypothetical protein
MIRCSHSYNPSIFRGIFINSLFFLYLGLVGFCVMLLHKTIKKEFRELKKYPKGHMINYHDALIKTGIFVPRKISRVMGTVNREVYFSRRSLKHLVEKQSGETLLELLPLIINEYNYIFQGRVSNRFLFVKYFKEFGGRPHVASIEVTKKDNLLVVTIFKTDDDYLKDFEILWRTGAD